MKKLFSIVLIFVVLFSALIIGDVARADPTYEDFTTYTEVDPNNHIEIVGTNHIDHFSIRTEDAYLYSDKGEDFFTDFEHFVDAKSSFTDSSSYGCFWLLANSLDDARGLRIAGENVTSVYFYRSGGQPIIALSEFYSTTEYIDTVNCGYDTWYYFRIKKVETSFTCRIWSNSDDRDNNDVEAGSFIDELSLTLHVNDSFRYVYACCTTNTADAYDMDVDIENLELQIVIDDPPEYSNVGDDGVTQVGEYVTVYSYWTDDFELDTAYVEHNSTGTPTNYSVSVSGSSSWVNKTFQLNYTVVVVRYRIWCMDNASQWNVTSYSSITTTQLTLTFYLNNSTMGAFYVDSVEKSNGTTGSYDYDASVSLMGVPANSSFVFSKFQWDSNFAESNPYSYTTNGNRSIWCIFDDAGVAAEENPVFLVVAIIAGLMAALVLIASLSRRKGGGF